MMRTRGVILENGSVSRGCCRPVGNFRRAMVTKVYSARSFKQPVKCESANSWTDHFNVLVGLLNVSRNGGELDHHPSLE